MRGDRYSLMGPRAFGEPPFPPSCHDGTLDNVSKSDQIMSGASEAVQVFLECGATVSEGHRQDAENGGCSHFNPNRPGEC